MSENVPFAETQQKMEPSPTTVNKSVNAVQKKEQKKANKIEKKEAKETRKAQRKEERKNEKERKKLHAKIEKLDCAKMKVSLKKACEQKEDKLKAKSQKKIRSVKKVQKVACVHVRVCEGMRGYLAV